MIAGLLPPGSVTVVATAADDARALAELPAVERGLIADAVAKRQLEFAGARRCARLALARLGRPAAAIPAGARGAPSWPAGVVGSITHCAGLRAAAVAQAHWLPAIGIDAEPRGPLPGGVLPLVAGPVEREQLARLPAGLPWDRVLFCAKEAVFKAWFPLTGRGLAFTEAEVRFEAGGAGTGRFRAELLIESGLVDGRPLTGFDGRYRVTEQFVLAAVALISQDCARQ